MRRFAIPELYYAPESDAAAGRPWALVLVDDEHRALEIRVADAPPAARGADREVVEAIHEELRRLAAPGKQEELNRLYHQNLKNFSLTLRMSDPPTFMADSQDQAVGELDRRAAAAWRRPAARASRGA